MAHLEYSNITHEACLVQSKDETKLLLPFIKRCLKKEKKLEEKYRDIHESGEASEREENCWIKHQCSVEVLESLIHESETLLKPDGRRCC